MTKTLPRRNRRENDTSRNTIEKTFPVVFRIMLVYAFAFLCDVLVYVTAKGGYDKVNAYINRAFEDEARKET